jgi:uncharacterized protein DUF1799
MRTDAALRKRAEMQGVPYVSKLPLSTVHPPPLLPENADAWNLFAACQTQVITAGLGTVVGIDESTLKWKMDLFEIAPDEQLDVLEKVQLIADVFVRHCARASASSTPPGSPSIGR